MYQPTAPTSNMSITFQNPNIRRMIPIIMPATAPEIFALVLFIVPSVYSSHASSAVDSIPLNFNLNSSGLVTFLRASSYDIILSLYSLIIS